ncbi:MAG: PfkB family carbohydrate kinase [bacterium]|nr:PfkB family carbohydrate kinase [bacterium]
MTADLHALIAAFSGQQIMVIGDVILDEYLIGRAARMSREAPIPVLEFEERRVIAGGAANPAANIVALGGAAWMVGVVGADAEAVTLRQILDKKGIHWRGLIEDRARATTVKTRVMAQMGLRFPQQVARIDKVARHPIAGDVEQHVCEYITQHAGHSGAKACLFSDYGGGIITPAVIDSARRRAAEDGMILTADAQSYLDKYRGFDVVKCNADDAAAFTGRALHTPADFEAAARELCAALDLRVGMVITRGGDGATLAQPNRPALHIPSPHVSDVFDTVGAGDTHIAVITLALCASAALMQAVTLANAASSIVVQHVGNYAPTPGELIAVL